MIIYSGFFSQWTSLASFNLQCTLDANAVQTHNVVLAPNPGSSKPHR